MPILKTQVTPPPVRSEIVTVPELGGDIIIRGLLLSDRLALIEQRETLGNGIISFLLAACVVDSRHEPIYTRLQWEQFGAAYEARTLELFATARRLCGLDPEDAEKK